MLCAEEVSAIGAAERHVNFCVALVAVQSVFHDIVGVSIHKDL
jgi:hypothetical protein